MNLEEEQPLEHLLLRASYNQEDAIRDFFKTFLESTLYVAERSPLAVQKFAPKYPTNFFPYLGILDSSRSTLPAFTNESYAQEWSSGPISLKKVAVKKLLESMPKDWWLILNSGQFVTKELSPWEIEALQSADEASIEELVKENVLSETYTRPEYLELEETELNEISTLLRNYGQNSQTIRAIKIAREYTKDEDERPITAIHLALEIQEVTKQQSLQERMELTALVEKHYIGRERVTVLYGMLGEETLALNTVAHIPYLWRKDS